MDHYNALKNNYVDERQQIFHRDYFMAPADKIALANLVFFTGSEADCQFYQKLRVRTARGVAVEDGIGDWHWRNHPLSYTELHWLLVGLVVNSREDRVPLWEFAKIQLSMAQDRDRVDEYYFRLAVAYRNNEAVDQFLRAGFVSFESSMIISPHVLFASIIQITAYSLPIERKIVSRLPQDQLQCDYTSIGTCSLEPLLSILKSHGAKGTSILRIYKDRSFITIAIGGFILLHTVILPLAVGFSFEPRAREPRRLKFLYLYAWSLSAMVNSTCLLFKSQWLSNRAVPRRISRALFAMSVRLYVPRLSDSVEAPARVITVGSSLTTVSVLCSLFARSIVFIVGYYVGIPWMLHAEVLSNEPVYKLFITAVVILCCPLFFVFIGLAMFIIGYCTP